MHGNSEKFRVIMNLNKSLLEQHLFYKMKNYDFKAV